MNRRRSIGVILGALALALTGCDHALVEPGGVVRDGEVVRGTGTVMYYNLEGGLHAIRGDDGVTYNPMNLPEAFRGSPVPVRFEGRIRSDMGSIHQVGPVVELTKIERR